ncbi:basic amino acid ABC transporter substrate-binding protein [Andreprevotia chitinilytica]|uniref:basic amino acid ABC transporter substrate-binding protein n=1 Tax=Andreprevotia chitinilytica TaxID=396808 RepID=UPI000557F557|nr:basic amino acid ABC transporter substrate-binding protein [Andreprevotia chitinilytica]
MKHSIKWLLSALLLATLAACGAKAEKAADGANIVDKTYRVGMNAAFAPFESVDATGKIVGFDVDLMNAIAEQAGIKVQFVNTPWEGIFTALSNGDIDVIASGVTITNERKQSMAFTDPYFEAKQVILAPPGKNIATPDDLKQANKIAVTTGTTADVVAQKILGKTSPKITRFESLPLVLKELEGNGVDAAIGDNGVVANYVKFNPSKGFHIVNSEGFEKEFYGIAVRPGDAELREKLNAALKTLHDNGTYQKIYAQYFVQ